MLQYINEDHAALTWDQANQLVIDGKAAMTIMGDWVDGDYVAKVRTLKPGQRIRLTIVRDGQSRELALTVAERPRLPSDLAD